MNWLTVGAYLVIATALGLFAVALTIAVLWHYLSEGLRGHVTEMVQTYFRRLMRYGHTRPSTKTAVVCSLVVWLGIGVAFTFPEYWRTSVAALLLLPVIFFAAGWRRKGPRATNHRLRFTYTFFEPAVALAIPSVAGKLVDAGLRALIAAL